MQTVAHLFLFLLKWHSPVDILIIVQVLDLAIMTFFAYYLFENLETKHWLIFFICSRLFWPNLLRARLLRRRRLRLSKGLARGQLRSAWSRSSTMPSGLFRPRRLWSRHPEVRLQGTVDWTWLLQRSVHRTLTIVSPIVRSLNKPCLEPSALIAANT